MHNFSVVNKGEYKHKQTSDVLNISRFLIVRKRAKRYLLLDLENLKTEEITGLNLQIDQFDARGNSLGALKVSFDKLSCKKGKFILKEKIELHRACVDFLVKILCVEYGDFKYRLGSKETFVVYEKSQPKEKVTKQSVEKEVGKEGRVSLRRVFSIPLFVSLLAICVIAASIAVTFFHLNKFKKEETGFFLENVKYEFIDGVNKKGAELQVVDYVGLGGGDLIIPDEIEGYPVTRVVAGAFESNLNIKSIKAEGDVTIEAGAFRRCINLESVEIIGTADISSEAFKSCITLKNVSLGVVNSIGKQAFYGCTKLENLNFRSTVSSVEELAFYGCKNLKSFTLPDSVSYIGEKIIANCYFIEEIKVPFLGASATESSTLGYLFGQPKFLEQANVIPSALKKVTLTKQKALAEGAFYGCKNLKEIILPEGLETITKNSFAYCYKLKFLTIPSTVSKIEQEAFAYNFRLFEVENKSPSLNVQIGDSVATYAFVVYTPMNSTRLEKITSSEYEFLKVGETYVLTDTPTLDSLILPTSANGANYAIPSYFFYDCNATTVTLSSGVSYILDRAFYQTGITQIASTGGNYILGEQVFYENSKLNTLNFEKATFTNLPSECFAYNKALRAVTLPESLTVIPDGAFKDCTSLQSISLPKNVTEIGSSAFENCSVLVNVGLKHLVNLTTIKNLAFSNCQEMTNVEFPTNVQTIGDNAFKNTKVKVVTLPDTIQEIGQGVFEECSLLAKLTVPFIGSSLQERATLGYLFGTSKAEEHSIKISQNLFEINVTLDDVITDCAFYGCSNLTSVNYTKNVRTIGSNAFRGCTGVSSLDLTETVLKVGQSAFEDCLSLTAVNMPVVTEIGDRAFANSALSKFVVAATVTSIGNQAFENCYSLNSIKFEYLANSNTTQPLSIGDNAFKDCVISSVSLPSRVNSIGEGVFKNCWQLSEIKVPFIGSNIDDDSYLGYLFGLAGHEEHYSLSSELKKVVVTNDTNVSNKEFYGCSYLTEVTYKNGISKVGESAFDCCSSLKNLDLSSATEIGKRAFASSGIQVVELSSEITSIPEEAFFWCKDISQVSLNCVESIGRGAFSYCDKITSLTIPETVTYIGESAFWECSNLEIVFLSQNLSHDIEILGSAFYGCSQLLEVYNLANLDLECGSSEYGLLAYNAVYMPQEATAPRLVKSTYNGATYRYNQDVCVLVKYEGEVDELTLENVILDSNIITSYSIASKAFVDCANLKKLTITNAVNEIRDNAFTAIGEIGVLIFDGCEILLEYNLFSNVKIVIFDSSLKGMQYPFNNYSDICFKGSNSEWQEIFNVNQFYIYPNRFYKECFHGNSSNYWNYNSQGEINFDSQLPPKSQRVKEPSCYENGEIRKYCDRCGYEEFEIIENLGGHDYVSEIIVPATCVQGGQEKYTCTRESCGDSFIMITPSLGGHSFSSKITTPATCLASGEMTHTCTRKNCGYSYTTSIPSLGGHNYSSKITTSATCITDGIKKFTCTNENCNDSYVETINALGHDFNQEHYCNRCDAIEDFIVTANSSYQALLEITSNGGFDVLSLNANEIRSTNSEVNTSATVTVKANKRLTITFKAKLTDGGYGRILVTSGWNTNEISTTDEKQFTFSLNAGESVTITFTRNDVEFASVYGYVYDIAVSQ